MEFKLDPAVVNKYVSEQILNSQLGESLRQLINKTIEDVSKSYNNPFEHVIKQHVANAIEHCVTTQYKEKIREEVKKRVTEDKIDQIVEAMWSRLKDTY